MNIRKKNCSMIWGYRICLILSGTIWNERRTTSNIEDKYIVKSIFLISSRLFYQTILKFVPFFCIFLTCLVLPAVPKFNSRKKYLLHSCSSPQKTPLGIIHRMQVHHLRQVSQQQHHQRASVRKEHKTIAIRKVDENKKIIGLYKISLRALSGCLAGWSLLFSRF